MAPRFAICICTRARPDMLRDCLGSIARQELSQSIGVEVVVIDNDPAASALPVVDRAQGGFPFALRHVHEPRTGIPQARNRALDEALRSAVDWIVFVDDDETAEPGWLAAYASIAETTPADVVVGPVAMALPAGSWFVVKDKTPTVGRPLTEATTANVMLRATLVVAPPGRAGRRFDEALRFSGGEDTDFFTCAALDGALILGDLRPVVREEVAPSKLTFEATLLRGLRVGRNYVGLRRKLGGTRAVAGTVPKLARRFAAGVLALVATAALVGFDRRRARLTLTKSVTRFGWAAGALVGMSGGVFEPYRKVHSRSGASRPPAGGRGGAPS